MDKFRMYVDEVGNPDVGMMAESRGGKEDRRLKDSFHRLWEHGTKFVVPEHFQKSLTSGELKVKSNENLAIECEWIY